MSLYSHPFLTLFTVLSLSGSALSSTTQVVTFNSERMFRQGDFEQTRLNAEGHVVTSALFSSEVNGMLGPVLAMHPTSTGTYIVTSGPGALWKIKQGQKPEKITNLPHPLNTRIIEVKKHLLAILSGPKGGITFVNVKTKKTIGTSPFDDMEILLDGVRINNTLYVVGGGEEGALYKASISSLLQDAKKEKKSSSEKIGSPKQNPLWKKLASVEEKHLRSIAISSKKSPKLILGGGDKGIVYSWTPKKLHALFDGQTTEVTDVIVDRQGRVYASLVDADGKWSAGSTERDKKSIKSSPARKVKSAEVIRIDLDGRVSILWQSKKMGAYALALFQNRLYVGTGSKGRLLALNPNGNSSPEFIAERDGHDEITSLQVFRDKIFATTAHSGGLLKLSPQAATRGFYYSPVIDATHNAQFGSIHLLSNKPVRVFLRSGNTKTPNETWSAFHLAAKHGSTHKVPSARYVQLKAELLKGTQLSSISLAFLAQNRAPEIDHIEAVAPGYRLELNPEEMPSLSRSITLSGTPFKKITTLRKRLYPKNKERTAKQIKDSSQRIFYVHVEDPDKDKLYFKWWIRSTPHTQHAKDRQWQALTQNKNAPFISVDLQALAAGNYQIRVRVSDSGSNSPARALYDDVIGPVFSIVSTQPVFSKASLIKMNGNRFKFKTTVESALPLVSIRCKSKTTNWFWIDPIDGIVDDKHEVINTSLNDTPSLYCEAIDEANNLGSLRIKP